MKPKYKWICESCSYEDSNKPIPKDPKNAKVNKCPKCKKDTFVLIEIFH